MGTLSLNGRYLSSVDYDRANLMVYDLVTGENRLLTSDGSGVPKKFAYQSAMSPDGTEVAYSWWHPFNGRDSSSVDLRIVGHRALRGLVAVLDRDSQTARAGSSGA